LGVVIIYLLGIHPHDAIAASAKLSSLHPWIPRLNHWTIWEFAALLWNLVFDGIIYFTFPFPKNSSSFVVRLIALFLIAGIGVLTAASFATLTGPFHHLHVVFVLLIGVVFATVDFTIFKYLPPLDGDIFRRTFYLADLPMIGAFGILVAYQLYHSRCFPGMPEQMSIFTSGAISFQLVQQNVVFAVIQLGAVQRMKLSAAVPSE
jgi:hypothetical protein